MELTVAIYGAIFGLFATLMFELGRWFLKNKRLEKIIKMCLYHEIDDHRIVELEWENGQPNFDLVAFRDCYYKNNIGNMVNLFDEKLFLHLTSYYSCLNNVKDYQENILRDDVKANEWAADHYGYMNRMDVVVAISGRKFLLKELKKSFKEDPSEVAFIDVPDKYKEWFGKFLKK